MNKIIVFIMLVSEMICINKFENVYTTPIIKNEAVFRAQEIPNYVYENMLEKSIPIECKDIIDISTLSYLQISYIGFDNKAHVGEMIVNKEIADEILDIFKELYEIKYKIEKIRLIDEYDANDELSMADNNTSCFCYRLISGTDKISNHAKGRAIDVNPLYNPYVSKEKISPVSATLYADRSINQEYQVNENDSLYKIFVKYGWSWGGNWTSKKDYQHFEKNE